MMKDTVLLIQLVAVVGGMDSILKDPNDFMSAVSFYLINYNYSALSNKCAVWNNREGYYIGLFGYYIKNYVLFNKFF